MCACSQERISGLLFSHPHQHLLSFAFLEMVILIGVTWDLKVAFVCISPVAKAVGHGFPGIYCPLAFYGSLYILDINPLPDVPLCIMAASLLWWPFPVLYRSFLISWHPIYQFLAFFSMLLQFCSESPCLANIWKCLPMFFNISISKFQVLHTGHLGPS